MLWLSVIVYCEFIYVHKIMYVCYVSEKIRLLLIIYYIFGPESEILIKKNFFFFLKKKTIINKNGNENNGEKNKARGAVNEWRSTFLVHNKLKVFILFFFFSKKKKKKY
jgi:hypothetical protein